MEIIQSPSPNFTSGRGGKKIVAIVVHITAGLMPGCLSWLRNPKSKASAHYLVTKAGAIHQLVQDKDMAWHAGFVNKLMWDLYDGSNPNRYTIGIEFECISGGELTEPQYQSGLWLIDMLCKKYDLPCDTLHIIGHYRIDGLNRPNDPGANFPWTRLFKELREGLEVPEWVKKIMDDAKAVGLITSDHDPNESAKKWFVLAIVLNAIKIIKGGK